MVRHGPQFLHAKDLAHFVNDTVYEVGTSVTQEPGWGPEYQDVTLIQKLGDGFKLFDHRSHTCFMKWSYTKTLATLGDVFSSKVVSILVKSTCKRSRGAVAMIGCKGALDKLPSCCKQCLQVLMACHN